MIHIQFSQTIPTATYVSIDLNDVQIKKAQSQKISNGLNPIPPHAKACISPGHSDCDYTTQYSNGGVPYI
ncbi:hypothetical protein HYC85_011306 [Camellia sinensis]|uniref:Uncharacterized protein n=1 Tax=Camellia sinensis TaxID=4442 RepID=A0A7J7H8P7_CAMSI|nr:hypothetical protein HYC85_011306 [Camellia sinensis]